MQNEILATIYCSMFIITVFMVFTTATKNLYLPHTRGFISLCVTIAGWQLLSLLYMLIQDPVLCCFIFDAKLVFVALGIPQLLTVSVGFYKNEPLLKRKWQYVALYAIPVITSILAVTSFFHPFIRTRLEVVQVSPVHVVINERGIWFWVHTVYSYAITLLAGILILLQLRRAPKEGRGALYLMGGSVLAATLGNVVVLSNLLDNGLDFTLIGLTAGIFLGYVAIQVQDPVSFLTLARDRIFHHMEDSVFILDTKNNIADYNEAAKNLLKRVGVVNRATHFSRVLEKLLPAEEADLDAARGTQGTDIAVAGPDGPAMYNIKLRDISNQVGEVVGTLASFTEVTYYRSMIDELEQSADKDYLTGLGNRRAYERGMAELNTAKHLPLGVVMGDVNLLKDVNDRHGHKRGDELLQLVAYALESRCPAGGCCYRVGGDEFMVLLPHTSPAGTQQYVGSVLLALNQVQSFPVKPSIALGYATKLLPEEKLSGLTRQAERMMYDYKSKNRGHSGIKTGSL